MTSVALGIMSATTSLLLGLLFSMGTAALNNGVGKLPALGFNSKCLCVVLLLGNLGTDTNGN